MKTLFVAWRSGDEPHRGWGPVGMLQRDGDIYRFCYTQGAKMLHGFRPFTSMTDMERVYESEELFPLFANRLLSKTRPEYEAYLRWGGFNSENLPDPIAILEVTGGIRQTDSIEVFPCPLQTGCGFYNKFFLHGIRWMPPAAIERINRLRPNDNLFLMPDPCNSYDPNAVAVRTDAERTMIGYVPRYLARDFLDLMSYCNPESITLHVNRLNLDAPMQQRVLCEIASCWPENFQPCQGEEFRPIPADIEKLCKSEK
jgi:hypothetical protein